MKNKLCLGLAIILLVTIITGCTENDRVTFKQGVESLQDSLSEVDKREVKSKVSDTLDSLSDFLNDVSSRLDDSGR